MQSFFKVLNDTKAYYSYFDATPLAEFLFDCIEDTIENLIPQKIIYLQRYDEFKTYVDNQFEMPDKLIALLIQCLEHNDGKLSKSKKENHFKVLTQNEVIEIEEKYNEIFNSSQK